MRLDADEIVRVLQQEIAQYGQQVESREVGEVLEIGDGMALVYGLAGVMSGEMVEFTRTKVRGLAFNLEENSVGVIILGNYLEIVEGDEVRSTGALLQVPVGEAMVGRVVDPLGQPLDGKGDILASTFRPIESVALGVVERQPVKTPLQTGIKAIDAMTPIGRGQRGREAYPGDVFSCPSRLLERSARAADRYVIVPGNAEDAKVADDWGVNAADSPKEPRKSGAAGKVYIGPKGREEAEHDLGD